MFSSAPPRDPQLPPVTTRYSNSGVNQIGPAARARYRIRLARAGRETSHLSGSFGGSSARLRRSCFLVFTRFFVPSVGLTFSKIIVGLPISPKSRFGLRRVDRSMHGIGIGPTCGNSVLSLQMPRIRQGNILLKWKFRLVFPH